MTDYKHLLVLQRLWQVANVKKPDSDRVEDATVGYMTAFTDVGGKLMPVHACYTIENGGQSSKERNKDRRIMPGKYQLRVSKTKVPLPREYVGFGYQLIDLMDANFADRRIFIHAGNYPQDTEGCILLQSTYDTSENPGSGRGSMRAVKTMYDLFAKFTKSSYSLTLEIRDESAAIANPPV